MRTKFPFRALVRGVLLAAVTGVACWLAATLLARRLYYLAALMPASAMVYLLAAWLSYLRGDGLARRRDDRPAALPRHAAPPPETSDTDPRGNVPRDIVPLPFGYFAPRGDTLVERAPVPGESEKPGEGAAGTRLTLFVAGVCLSVLSATLYFFAGVGARYFL